MKKVILFSLIVILSVSNIAYGGIFRAFIDDVIKFFEKNTDNFGENYLKRKLTKIRPKWRNTHIKGRFGDYLTAKRMTAMGYTKLKSKISTIHGLDGVYIKKRGNDVIEEIIVIENKVDTAQLNPGPPRQMSVEWIEKNIKSMLNSSDIEVRKTGEILMQNKEKIKAELWKHDTITGKTVRYAIDKNGFIDQKIYEWNDRMIENTLHQWCSHELIECY